MPVDPLQGALELERSWANRNTFPPIEPEIQQQAVRLEREYEGRLATQRASTAIQMDAARAHALEDLFDQRDQITKVWEPAPAPYQSLSPEVIARIIGHMRPIVETMTGWPDQYFDPSTGNRVPLGWIELVPSDKEKMALLLVPSSWNLQAAEEDLSRVRWARDRPIRWVILGQPEPE